MAGMPAPPRSPTASRPTTTIPGAAKVTGRLEGGWFPGVLQPLTVRATAACVDADEIGLKSTVEPAANCLVGRLRRLSGILDSGLEDLTGRAAIHGAAPWLLAAGR